MPHHNPLNVKPGMFRTGREAIRVLGIALLLGSWVVAGIVFAFWLARRWS